METKENKGRRAVDKKKLSKHILIVQRDFSAVKHKTILRKEIGSNKVSDYFNLGLANTSTENHINNYFEKL